MSRTQNANMPADDSFPIVDEISAMRNFLSIIILDAIRTINGERRASKREKEKCMLFLQSEKCARWLGLLGIEPDCISRVLNKR